MGDRLVRKGLAIGIIVLFVGSNFVSGLNNQLKNTTNTLITNRGYIQDLIDNASDGDTIYIPSGTYYENIIINKSISLVGEDKYTTIIDGGKIGDVIYVSADWANISRFTIRNGCDSGSKGLNAGIHTKKVKFITITSNIITSNYDNGIHINYSTYNTITDNIITSNLDHGIRISYSYSHMNSNIIANNIITSNDDDGIYIHHSNNNTITDNIITSNELSGVCISGSLYNTITDNDISRNIGSVVHTGYGIEIWGSLFNTITGNNIISNLIYGIEIYDSDFNNITGNNITHSWSGIFIVGNNNTIEGNNINLNNEYGIHLCGIGNIIEGNNIKLNIKYGIYLIGVDHLCSYNSILKNNFIYNRRHAYFDNAFHNTWSKNYWKGVISPHVRINGMLNFYKYDIWGYIIWELHIPWFNFDWDPAKKPYNITTTQVCDID